MSFIKEELAALDDRHLRRQLCTHDGLPGPTIEIEGKEFLNFSSNNYLGLAKHATLIEAARVALVAGTGSTASRLVTGNLPTHEELETKLSRFHEAPGARLFNSGYQANLGLISCLAGPEDLIVSDRLNHASVIDGCRLSKATIKIAEHVVVDAFRTCLTNTESFRRRFVVTDGVFSMDGDLAPVRELRNLCDEFDAFLIVDEAHSVGALGPGGRGICAEAGIIPDALVGGLGKSFGSYGGYVVGSEALVEYLLNQARSFVFSTALPPAVVAASLASLHLLSGAKGQHLRQELRSRVDELREGLLGLGLLGAGAGHSAIFPVIVGSTDAALAASQELMRAGVFCQAIRPPTVKKGTARLRVTLSAQHTTEDVLVLIAALSDLKLQKQG